MTALLPPRGPLRRYAVVVLVDSAGTGLFLTGSTLFFTRVVGLTPGAVGIGLSVAGLAALLAAVPLGSLGDRFGHRRVWVALTVVEALLFATYPWIGSFAAFVTVVSLVAVADVGASPIRRAYLSRIAGPEQRVRAGAYNQAVSNVGFGLGALVAGVALQSGTPAAFRTLVWGNAVSFAVVAVLLLTLPTGEPGPPRTPGHLFAVFRDRPFLAVSVLNGLLFTYAAVLTVALPLWIVRRTSAPHWSVAAVFVLDTAMAVALSVRFSRGAETAAGAAHLTRRAGFALLLGCVTFAAAGSFGSAGAVLALAAGTVLFTVGALWQSAGSFGLSYALAPDDRQGEYLGAWAMGSRIYDAVGPVLVIGLVIGLGVWGWLLLGVLFAVLAAAHVPITAWAAADRRTSGHSSAGRGCRRGEPHDKGAGRPVRQGPAGRPDRRAGRG